MRSFRIILIVALISVALVLHGRLASTIPPPFEGFDNETESLAQSNETVAEALARQPREEGEPENEPNADQISMDADPTETVVDEAIPRKPVEDITTELPEETWITKNRSEVTRPYRASTEDFDEWIARGWTKKRINILDELAPGATLEEEDVHLLRFLLSKLKPAFGPRTRPRANYTYLTALVSPNGSLYIPSPSTRTPRQHFVTLWGFIHELSSAFISVVKMDQVYTSPVMHPPDEPSPSTPPRSEHFREHANLATLINDRVRPEDLFYTTKNPSYTTTATVAEETNPLMTADQFDSEDKAENITTVVEGEEADNTLAPEDEEADSIPDGGTEEESENSI